MKNRSRNGMEMKGKRVIAGILLVGIMSVSYTHLTLPTTPYV